MNKDPPRFVVTSQHPLLRRPSVGDARRPVHVHGLRQGQRRVQPWSMSRTHVRAGPRLHVQLQDVGVGLQQLTHVGFGPAEVSVDKLFDVAGRMLRKSHQRSGTEPGGAGAGVRIRPCLRLQAQVEVVGVHEPGAHAVDDPLTHGQGPAVQDPQGRLLVQGQVLDNSVLTRDVI